MKNVQDICNELKGLDGSVGAFVWNDGACLGSSLPKAYDTARLTQTATDLSRLTQLAQKANYNRCACVFHWQRATLFSWALNESGGLAVLALPTAPRGMLELSASIAVEDLLLLLTQAVPLASAAQVAAVAPEPSAVGVASPVAPAIQANVANAAEDHPKLRDLEELVVGELGPTGRVLFLRARQKAYRAGQPESAWLPRLRAAVLADLGDPSAWASVATSVIWIPSAS